MARLYKKHSRNKLDLSSNEIYSSYILRKIKNILNDVSSLDLVRYPEEESLFDTYSEMYCTSKDNIELGHGSDDLLNRIFSVFRGRNIYLKDREYQGALYYSNIYCNRVSYDCSDIVYLSSINNYGETLDKNILLKSIDDGKFIILDEAYSAYGESYLSLLKKYDNMVITKSMSKELGLAGFRSGLAISNYDFIEQLKKISCSYTSNSLSTLVIPKLIKEGFHKEHILKIREGLAFLKERIECEETQGPFVIIPKNKIPKKIKEKVEYKDLGDKIRITATSLDYLLDLGI